ncbi:unnamed protein product, partial [Polarella glacialis]
WDLASDAPLKIVHTLDGARAAMKEGEIDAWLWEKFTTKFLVDQGEWDIIGEVPTPWPCFCFVASDKALQTRAKEIQSMVEVTKGVCDEFKANLGNRTISYVVKKHASTETDASEWLSGTQWACALEVQKQTLQKTQEALVTIGQLKEAVSVDKVYHAELCRLTD